MVSELRLVAANIRTELKRAFPKVKFSVRADGYSSIDITGRKVQRRTTSRDREEIRGDHLTG